MRKLFEAQFNGYPLSQEWNCLEARPTNIVLPATSVWGCSGTEITGTVNTIGGGDTNTDLIIAGCVSSAASASRQLFGGFNDWYLPTGVELQAMYAQRSIIPDFGGTDVPYWSSYEDSATQAYYMTNGSVTSILKTFDIYVRAIRKVSGNYNIGDTGPGGGVIFYKKQAEPTHKLSIYDMDLVEDDSAQDIILESPGYSVTWDAGIKDIVTGSIIESSAEFTIRNIDGILTDFMEDLAASEEGRFLVDIQKKTVLDEEWQGFWKGILMPDFSGRQDIPNEPISFQATDGMALLDAIEITSADSELFLVTILKGLRQIPTYNLFAILSELRFLWVKTDWFCENLPLDEEPLYQIGLFGQSVWVKKVTKEGYSGDLVTTTESLTYKEVIQHICEKFNCILMMQQGSWYLFQRDLLEEDSIEFNTFRAYPTGIPDNWRINPWAYEVETYKQIDQVNRYRSEGDFYYLPALKSVEAIYGGGNLADGSDSLIPSGFIPDQSYTTMPLTTGSGNYLHIRLSFRENFLIDWVPASPPEEYFKARAEYKLVVQCGAYYLNPYTGEWSLDSSVSDLIIPSTYLYHLQNAETGTWSFIDQVLVERNIITDDLPDDGEITFELQRYQIQIFSGGSYFTCDIADDFGFVADLENHFCLAIVNNENPVNYATFMAENTEGDFQLEIDLGESLFGTARVIMNRVIGYNNGGGELWNKGYASSKDYYFNQLLVREVLANQIKGLLCYSGTIYERNENYFDIRKAIEIVINSITYRLLFNNVTYNAQEEKWEGDWIEVSRDVATIVPELNDFPIGLDDQPASPRPAGSEFDQALEDIYNIDTGVVDLSQRGTAGAIITNDVELINQTSELVPPEAGRTIMYPDEQGILKQADAFGNLKTVGVDSSKVIPSPDVIIYDGYLYNWLVTQEADLISTAGWAVPTRTEFETLINYLIAQGFNYDDTTTGNKIGKAIATDSEWDPSVVIGAVGNTDYPAKQNVTGFSIRPAGGRNDSGVYYDTGAYTAFWSKTGVASDTARMFTTYFDTVSGLSLNTTFKKYGFPIRLFRTATAPEQALGDGQVIHAAYIGNDGKVYDGVVLGTQVWLNQNLTETLYNTGVEIPLCEDADIWAALTVPARCSYDNDASKSFTESDEIIFTDAKVLSSKYIKYRALQVSADYEMTFEDYEIEITANSPTITTLDVATYANREITITNIGSGIGTITGDVLGGDFSLYQYESLTLRSNGTNWVAK